MRLSRDLRAHDHSFVPYDDERSRLNPDATPRLSKRTGLGTERDSIDGSLDS